MAFSPRFSSGLPIPLSLPVPSSACQCTSLLNPLLFLSSSALVSLAHLLSPLENLQPPKVRQRTHLTRKIRPLMEERVWPTPAFLRSLPRLMDMDCRPSLQFSAKLITAEVRRINAANVTHDLTQPAPTKPASVVTEPVVTEPGVPVTGSDTPISMTPESATVAPEPASQEPGTPVSRSGTPILMPPGPTTVTPPFSPKPVARELATPTSVTPDESDVQDSGTPRDSVAHAEFPPNACAPTKVNLFNAPTGNPCACVIPHSPDPEAWQICHCLPRKPLS